MGAGAEFRVAEANWPAERGCVEALFREYAEGLGVDLGFQEFERELATLPGRYARPSGLVLIAWSGEEPAGIGALRMAEPGVCEMKRLYVRPAYRGAALGRELALELIAAARDSGYRAMVLDTLATMDAAQRLYRSLGFRRIPAYYDNPLPGALYFGLDL